MNMPTTVSTVRKANGGAWSALYKATLNMSLVSWVDAGISIVATRTGTVLGAAGVVGLKTLSVMA